ncbi:MAG: VWA domain-containing protein [Betaproteobacteria bacterium]|nr:VWA domain-containing protein [Betaproteobacteria bacterium]
MKKAPETTRSPTLKTLAERWQQAWPLALEVWSKYTRLRDAHLCASRAKAARHGLTGSFAMIRLHDQSIVVDLESIAEHGLEDYAVEILAHEVGHHVLAPGNTTDHFRLLARIRRGLPTLESHTAMVANLYTDLLINDRLQRRSGLRMADIYRRLAQSSGTSESGVWNLYLRIYENLWKLDAGSLSARKTSEEKDLLHRADTQKMSSEKKERMEGDAWLGARLIRVYADDWLTGAGRFAALLLPYLAEDAERAEKTPFIRLLDTVKAAAGSDPMGGIEIEPDEAAVHPSEDPAITGMESEEESQPPPEQQAEQARGQRREPFEYGEILRAAGIRLDDHEIAVRYYRECALPHLVPFPTQRAPESPEPQMEGLEPWEIGDPLDELDALQTVLQSPRVIPGLTTVRRLYGREQGHAVARQPVDLDMYVDSSGSMPNPQINVSYLSLAGAIIALSALRAGSRVQATLWSGKKQVMHTQGFVRDEREILRILTGFYGGWTCFPIHRLRETFCGASPPTRPVHILMISDDGITTMFDRDERGNDGWEISARALTTAGAGGTMALNISSDWIEEDEWLKRARDEQHWEIFPISDLEDLVAFARAFSRRHYSQPDSPASDT